MAYVHDNGLSNDQSFNFQDESSFDNMAPTMSSTMSSNISRSGVDLSPNHYLDSANQSQQNYNLLENLNLNETQFLFLTDWSTIKLEDYKETNFGSPEFDNYTISGDAVSAEHSRLSSPRSAISTVDSAFTISTVPHNSQSRSRSNDVPQEHSGTVVAHRRASQKTQEKKGAATKYLTKAERHGKVLERNRVAASKCRQKKKDWTACLEEEARDLQQKRNTLSQSVASMKDELLYLKGEILKHSTCRCPTIKAYLETQASKLVGVINAYSRHTSDMDNVFLEA